MREHLKIRICTSFRICRKPYLLVVSLRLLIALCNGRDFHVAIYASFPVYIFERVPDSLNTIFYSCPFAVFSV